MCFKRKVELPTGYPIFQMPYSELVAKLASLNIEWMCRPKFQPDHFVLYTEKEAWDRIVPFLVSPADRYVIDGADCDDYAKWASAKAALEFGLGGCLECFGSTPDGYHAYNLVVTDTGLYLLEPNAGFLIAGELFNLGANDYLTDSWK